jgi:hypothetical protein
MALRLGAVAKDLREWIGQDSSINTQASGIEGETKNRGTNYEQKDLFGSAAAGQTGRMGGIPD